MRGLAMAAPVETPIERAIARLVRLSDPEGVLSVYADVSAERGHRHHPRAGEIAMRRDIEALADAVDREGPRTRSRRFAERIGELRAVLREMCDPARPGGGRALFVQLSSGATHLMTTARPVGALVVLAPRAHVAPLLRALADDEPAGAIAIGDDGARAVDVRGDRAEEILRVGYGIPSADWRPMVGPAAANPAHRRESESQRDLFARRLEEHRLHRLAELGPGIWAEARRRGWARAALAGAPAHRAALVATRPDGGPDLIELPHHLPEALSAAEVAAAVGDHLAAARADRTRRLAERVRDAALTRSGRAAVGLDDVLAALGEGRVSRLLLDVERRPRGAVAPDGRLAVSGERIPGVDPADLVDEPHLLDRMIGQALETGAELVPLTGPASAALAMHDGFGAELRW
jgi:hypothetical protein